MSKFVVCRLLVVLAAAVLVSDEARGAPADESRGMLETAVVRAEKALQSLWARARSDADGVVQGIVRGFRRQEHDALHTASVQLGQLGVDMDLTEAGDQVGDDLHGCAKATQAKYARLLAQLRRRVQHCWGWQTQEVASLVRAVEDLFLAGDRLPALLRTSMRLCLDRGRSRSRKGGRGSRGANDEPAGNRTATSPPLPPPPSPFRLLRCTADSVNLTWTYVTSVPREVGRAARKTAGLLGSSREDWAACSRAVIRQSAGPAMEALRDLGMCVADRVSERSWMQLHHAWQNPRR